MKWKNELPTVEGYYWIIIKRYIDGVFQECEKDNFDKSVPPDIGYVQIESDGSLEVLYCGDDCGQSIYKAIEERKGQREMGFMWDNEKTLIEKSKDIVLRRDEYWFRKIDKPSDNFDVIG